MALRKKANSKELLLTIEHLKDKLKNLEGRIQIPDAKWTAAIMGWEGQQAKHYWQAIGPNLLEQWTFQKRSRRPAKDKFNALINYGYGMLYSKMEQALFAAGLDPHLGILHADEYDRPTLSYDLIEPFRPWLDRLVIENILQNKIDENAFDITEDGVFLSNLGKRWLIPTFNAWLLVKVRWHKKQLSREAHFFHAAARLAKLINQFSRPGK